MNAPLPKNEKARLQALENYQILDTVGDEIFDRITRLATAILKVPISCISFIDEQRQWFKSHSGLDDTETARDVAFCAHAILADEILVVEDATKDERFRQNPLVTGGPHIRFYAGAPLTTEEGFTLGTLCAIDRTPRQLSDADRNALRDLAAMVMNELHLRKLAAIDSLTRACSRQFFMEMVNREIARAVRHKTPLSVLGMDADKFKVFNDTYGHPAGDLALVHLVQQAKNVLRPEDVMGRLGGEEFAVVLPNTGAAGAAGAAERVRASIANTPLTIGDLKLPLTVSIGVAEFDPNHDTLARMMKRADEALYRAKSEGRNRVATATASRKS